MSYRVGSIIDFTEEEKTIIVVMSGSEGVRYIDPRNLEFDGNGALKTHYISCDDLMNKPQVVGNAVDVVKEPRKENIPYSERGGLYV